MKLVPLYGALAVGAYSANEVYRKWPEGVAWNEPEFLYMAIVQIATAAGVTALILWLALRDRKAS